jgi:hypothetical protein
MTTATQINVTLPNGPGMLAKLCDLLRSADVNIEALFCTEETDHSVLHLVVDDTETAKIMLQPIGDVTTTTLLAFRLKNKPGAIAQVARMCAGAQLNIAEIYSTTSGKEATVYVSLDNVEKGLEVFGKANASTLPALAMAK